MREPTPIPPRRSATVDAHRAGHSSGLHPEDAPYLTDQKKRYPKNPLDLADTLDFQDEPTRIPTSAVRLDRPSRRETTHFPPAPPTRVFKQRRFTLARFLVMFGLLLFFLAFGIVIFNGISNWWQLHTDDVTFGRPRTYQTDQYVGQGDSPTHPNHFLALNLNGVVEVVEINTQDAQKDHVYYITTTNSPLNPVTLSFPTVEGKQYMYVNIGDQNSAYTVAMVNDGKEFTGAQH